MLSVSELRLVPPQYYRGFADYTRAYWKAPVQARRIKGGVSIAGHVRGFTVNVKYQWIEFDTEKKGERWLECPKCGHDNAARNFYRRRDPRHRQPDTIGGN